MDTRVSPNPPMAAEVRRQGHDLDYVEGASRRAASAPESIDTLGPLGPISTVTFEFLNNDLRESEAFLRSLVFQADCAFPNPPVSAAARLFALRPNDAVDRVSCLPDALLGNIVSRLPVKDAARTAALSRRWCGVWCSAPLVLVDADLSPVTSADLSPVTSAVSSVLAAHPGPIRCVHLTSGSTAEFHALLTPWLQLLAKKGIQELVLVNRLWPLHFDLPATFLGMATLTRLYLGLWIFPSTVGRPRAACFPNLRELVLCNVFVHSRDLDFILDRSPVLEMLCVKGNLFRQCLRLVSQSLKLLVASFIEEIFVVDAPHLEQLFHSEAWTPGRNCTKIKIGHAPKLRLLGSLDPGHHVLEFGSTIIKAGTRLSPSTIVPSVRYLAMDICFVVRNDAKMVPTVLRRSPNVETLDITSGKTDQSVGKLNLQFWHKSGTIECIQSSIKLLVFRDFRGSRSELAFLKFFFESALVLEKVEIMLAAGFTSMEQVQSKVETLGTMKRASEASSVLVTGFSGSQGGYVRRF